MTKRGKKYQKAIADIQKQKEYSFEEAIDIAIKSSYVKFDETIDVTLSLSVNPKHSDQMVRGAVVLPNGTGRKVKVIVFAKGDKEQEALDAGANEVGAEDLIKKIKDGWFDFDKTVASPDMMGLVGRIAKILGPKGLMPNAKLGTITKNIGQAVRELKAGKVEFRVEKAGIVHAPIGKVSFGKDKVIENAKVLIKKINRLKPPVSKGKYIKKLFVSTTMGPSIKIDENSIKEI